MKWDSSITDLELAWRLYRPQFPAQNVTDITLRGRHAQLRQQLTFTWPRDARSSYVRLRVPKSVPLDALTVSSGGKRMISNPDSRKTDLLARPNGPGSPSSKFVWVELAPGFAEREQQVLTLEFHQALPHKDNGPEPWKVPLIWPDDAVQLDAKVRVWCEPGESPQVLDPENRWQDLPSEIVDNRLPVLVLQGAGPNLDLTLCPPALADSRNSGRLPLMLCERALIQVTLDENGTQTYRARYVIPELHADALDVEFPAPVSVQSIEMGKVKIPPNWKENDWKIAHLVLEPKLFRQNLVLDIKYKLPASFSEGNPRLADGSAAAGLPGRRGPRTGSLAGQYAAKLGLTRRGRSDSRRLALELSGLAHDARARHLRRRTGAMAGDASGRIRAGRFLRPVRKPGLQPFQPGTHCRHPPGQANLADDLLRAGSRPGTAAISAAVAAFVVLGNRTLPDRRCGERRVTLADVGAAAGLRRSAGAGRPGPGGELPMAAPGALSPAIDIHAGIHARKSRIVLIERTPARSSHDCRSGRQRSEFGDVVASGQWSVASGQWPVRKHAKLTGH